MSISLAAAAIEQYLVGGTPIETNSSMVLASSTVDFIQGTMTWVFLTGSMNNGAFTPGQRGTSTSIVLNLSTGVWVNNQNSATGTFGAPAMTQITNFLKTYRNGCESAAVNQTIANGTQVPW